MMAVEFEFLDDPMWGMREQNLYIDQGPLHFAAYDATQRLVYLSVVRARDEFDADAYRAVQR